MSCRFCVHWRDYLGNPMLGEGGTGVCSRYPEGEETYASHYCGELTMRDSGMIESLLSNIRGLGESHMVERTKRLKLEKTLKIRNAQLKALRKA